MQRILHIMIGIFLVTAPAEAQILLRPSATGHVTGFHPSSGFSTHYEVHVPSISVGAWHSEPCYGPVSGHNWEGIIEFNITTPHFPPILTEYNFTARLWNLTMVHASGNNSIKVDLLLLEDECEDNVVLENDISCYDYYDPAIATRNLDLHNPSITRFDNIDVTSQIRQDLFDEPDAGSSIGFILEGHASPYYNAVFNWKNPRLLITIQGWDASPDGQVDINIDGAPSVDVDIDVDNDCDTDADADTDSDMDTDVDLDGDTDMDTDTDSDIDADLDVDMDSDADETHDSGPGDDAGNDGSFGLGNTEVNGCDCGSIGRKRGSNLTRLLEILLIAS